MGQPFSHLYVSVHGEYAPGTPWQGEKGQFGLRILLSRGLSQPGQGVIFDLPPGGEDGLTIEPHTEALSGTNGTLAQTWRLDQTDMPGTKFGGPEMVDMAEDIRVFLNATKGYHSANWRWTHVRFGAIKPDGSYAHGSSIYSLTTPLAGTGSVNSVYPPEVALVVSLRAPVMGRKGRGRFYLPALHTSLTAPDGVVNATAATAIANATKTMIQSLENLPGADPLGGFVMVTSAGSPQAVRPTEVRVGNHFDVQRRRQDQVQEAYTVAAI